MEPAGKTLAIAIDIASVSRKVFSALVKRADHKIVEASQLEKIVVTSSAILETLNEALFLRSGTVDDRLSDWLSGDEPVRCLEALNQMEALLTPKLEHSQGFSRNFFQFSRATSTKNNIDEAIKLFSKHESCFHFLLSTEIWNRECDTQQQLAAPANAQRTYEPSAHVDQRKAGYSTCEAQERKTRGQRVDEKLDAILKWLHAWDCSETYERTLLLRQQDTCMWLLNTTSYKTWRNTENSFLWLHGKAGAGKTVLSASVIDDLKSSLQDSGVLVYFYCDFQNGRSTSAAEVMRSFLFQLLQGLQHRVLDPGDLIDELIERKDGDATTISNVVLLAHYISRAAKQFGQQPFLVVDALDECTDVEDLLNAITELRKGGSRLFVTSRPLQIIRDGLSGSVSIDMDMMKYEVSADINLHIRRVLDSHRRLRIMDTSLKTEISSILCEKANVMFRWVQCQLSDLEQCMTMVEVREVLNNLPNNLHETYERVLLKMSKDTRESKVAQRALEWLAVTLSPLRLSQILEGLSIDPDRQVFDPASGPVHGPALLDVLGSLITYNEVTDVIILSHFSVKEYLTSDSTRTSHPAHYVDECTAHKQLALLCMCYIGIYIEQWSDVYDVPLVTCEMGMRVDDSASTVSSADHQVSPLLPSSRFGSLHDYVLSHGFHHLSRTDPGNHVVLHATGVLYQNALRHPSEWDQLCSRSRFLSLWPTLKHDFTLYILIGYTPASFLRSFISRTPLKPKDGTNPLVYAARFGKIEHAQILLSSGVSPSYVGLDTYSDYHQLLPLEAAVEEGDPLMVDLLLTKGSPVPHKIFVRALSRDCDIHARIVSKLLQTDEFAEWAVDEQDEELLLRALDPVRYVVVGWEPSQQDIDDVQRKLVQLGRDPSTRFNETSLRYAISAGHMSTVQHVLSLNIPFLPDIILTASASSAPGAAMIRLCLEKGCDVNAVSPMEKTALHLAMIRYSGVTEDDRLENVRVLVGAGCNPSRCDLTGETPLHLAAKNGYLPIAHHLLPLYGLLPPDILLAASESRNAAMIRLLASKGADVHIIAADGNTPLHRVLQDAYTHVEEEQQLGCIKVLVNAGCNPCLPNADGKSPLDLAAEHGYISVVQYLHDVLSSPFSPNILLSVAGSRSLEIVSVIKFLIGKGADVHVTGPNGDTLLHLAMTEVTPSWETNCLSRIEILINAGCDPRACNFAGETPFHTAARQGSTLVMEYLLSLGVSVPSDVMITQFEGEPHTISQRCSSVRFLLDRGGDIHAVSKHGDTLLHLTATLYPEQDALELAKYLVEAGCDPSALNSKQETPLHVAARHGFTSFIDNLLSPGTELPPDILLPASTSHFNRALSIRYLVQNRGVSAFVSTAEGNTPLHLLLSIADEDEEDTVLECVKILIDAGCDPNSQNASGETPLHYVVRRGYGRTLEYLLSQGATLPHDILFAARTATTLRLLLRRGVDLHSVAVDDITELMYRVLDTNPRTVENDAVEYAKILISAGWDCSSKEAAGETLVHVAARRGDIDAVKFFLSQNHPPPPDVLLAATSSVGRARSCSEAVALTRFFIRQGANVNAVSSTGDTPLHLVVMQGFPSGNSEVKLFVRQRSWEVIEILLDAGSDPYSRNADDRTLLDLAKVKGRFFEENFRRLVRNAHPDRPHVSE